MERILLLQLVNYVLFFSILSVKMPIDFFKLSAANVEFELFYFQRSRVIASFTLKIGSLDSFWIAYLIFAMLYS